MSSCTVEFRLLQLVLNPIGDERRTVAMLHWDGSDMRFAWNRSELHHIARHAEGDVRVVLDAIHKHVGTLLQTPQLRMSTGMRLAEVYPVTEGLTGLLTWGPSRMGQAPDPDAHFRELMRLLGLHVPGGAPQRPRRDGWILRQLVALGRSICEDLGYGAASDKVRIQKPIRGIVEATPPFSWLNGRWHHSFPINFEHSSTDSIAQKFQRAFGLISASTTGGEVGVIISVYPNQADFREELDGVERFARDRMGDRVECLRAPLLAPGAISTAELERRVRADLAHTH